MRILSHMLLYWVLPNAALEASIMTTCLEKREVILPHFLIDINNYPYRSQNCLLVSRQAMLYLQKIESLYYL